MFHLKQKSEILVVFDFALLRLAFFLNNVVLNCNRLFEKEYDPSQPLDLEFFNHFEGTMLLALTSSESFASNSSLLWLR